MEDNNNSRPVEPQSPVASIPDTPHEDAFGLNYAVYDDSEEVHVPESVVPAQEYPAAELNDVPIGHVIGVGFVVTSGLLSVINIAFWILLAGRPDYGLFYRIAAPILIVGEFVLAARTLNRTEAARIMCLYGTIILLIFSIFGSYDFIRNYHDRNVRQQNIISQTTQAINSYNSDTLVTPSEKSAVITELKATESADLSRLSKKNTYLPLLTIYMLTFLPVLLLERPEAKKHFA